MRRLHHSNLLGFLCLGMIFAGELVAAEQNAAEPCNVLLIIADDLNSRIEPLGDPDAITPNLTRLAQRSVTYRNCLSQYSLCFPSRASFLTGVHPWKLGVHQGGGTNARADGVLPGRQWLSEYFRSQDYWTGSYGKVEHDTRPAKWDELIPLRQQGSGPLLSIRNFGGFKGVSGDTSFVVYDGDPSLFTDGVTATHAITAMENSIQADRNFFVAAGLYMPHTSWLVAQSVADQYDASTLQLPADPPGSYSVWPSYVYSKGKDDIRPLMPEAELRELLRAYYSAVTMMDHAVGQLLDYLDANQLWENTVVIFASDNGFNLMEHRHLYSKRNYSRESIHVPMMIHHPGMTTEGQFCDRQVGLIDIFPTALDLAGIPPFPKPIDGQSLAPLQADPSAVWDKPALSALTYPRNSKPRFRIAQLGDIKLVEGPFDSKYRRLMDHGTDPFELFPLNPNLEPAPIDLTSMKAALAGIPFQNGVFYPDGPEGTPDRDGDTLSDELEIDLQILGLSPFTDDTDFVESLSDHGLIVRAAGGQLELTLESLPVVMEEYQAFHDYPFVLQRSEDLENWQDLTQLPTVIPEGFLKWTDDPGEVRKIFYRIGLGP